MDDKSPHISSGGAGDVWVSIYTCRTSQEAALAVAKLHSLGIPARVDGQEAAVFGQSWFGNLSPMNATIQVLKRDASDAKSELEAVDRRRAARMASVPCPKCGALNPDRVWARPRLSGIVVTVVVLVTIFTGFDGGWACSLLFVSGCAAMWPYMPRWRCKECGQRWVAPDPDSVVDDEEDSGKATKADDDGSV